MSSDGLYTKANMAGVKIQLKVIKADGSAEEYLHTKVIGAISNALAQVDEPDIEVAEQLAEVVTYFLYRRQNCHSVTSGEILSMIKVVLTAIKFEEAAIALSEHHFERKLKRSRVEVASMDVRELADVELLSEAELLDGKCRWDKSKIVDDLLTKHGLSRQTARAVASMVEEKIFKMGITLVPSSLIKQLVLGDAASVLRAQRQLQTV
jgi:transcriptional regulator NrdR family protein